MGLPQVSATAPQGGPPPYTPGPGAANQFGYEWVNYAKDALLSQGSARYLSLAFTHPTARIASFALQLFSAFSMIKVAENGYESLFGQMGPEAKYYIGSALLISGLGISLLAKSPLALAVSIVAGFYFSQGGTN